MTTNVPSLQDVVILQVLLQGRDGLQWLSLPGELPVVKQFCLVQSRPLKNESQGTRRQLPREPYWIRLQLTLRIRRTLRESAPRRALCRTYQSRLRESVIFQALPVEGFALCEPCP